MKWERNLLREPDVAAHRQLLLVRGNCLDELLNLLQWPAMVVTLTASWLIASQSRRKRTLGFWCFILSNILWMTWGLHDNAFALVALQIGLFVLNLRGVRKNDPELQASIQH